MKHPLFEPLGKNYPHNLEERYERILIKIEQLWDTPEVVDYFNDLLIDKRGGRKGFPEEVLADIVRLSRYREFFAIKKAEQKEEAAAQLASRGIELNAANFLEAVETGNKETLDLFLRAGFNIHVKGKDGTPPLITALIKGYTIIAQMLLSAGVEVNVFDKNGVTPLLLACGRSASGYRAVAEELINRGALVNLRDRLGHTPLLLALSGGASEVAEMLIERGADLSARGRDGETALSLAQKGGHDHIVRLLLLKQEKSLFPGTAQGDST